MSIANNVGLHSQVEDVLTPVSAAEYLRVPEDHILVMAEEGRIPAQKIGGEWRFLRKAVEDWLRYGERRYRKWPYQPPFPFEGAIFEDMLLHLEDRLLRRLKEESDPKPGSKQSVLRHFGAFQDDDDLEERLADARKKREAAG